MEKKDIIIDETKYAYIIEKHGTACIKKKQTDDLKCLSPIAKTGKSAYIISPKVKNKPKNESQARKMVKKGKAEEITGVQAQKYMDKAKKIRLNTSMDRVQLNYAGTSLSTGIAYYKLSEQIPYNEFKKVKELFTKINPQDDEADNMYRKRLSGWLTRFPEEVEEKLGIDGKRTLEYRRNKIEKDMEKQEEKEEKTKKIKNKIDSFFKDAEKPDPKIEQPNFAKKFKKGFEKMKVDGKVLYDSFDIYGGGEKYVDDGEYIWKLKNNGHDGDDWSLNNVSTGGAGAIGRRVKKTDKLVSLFNMLKKLEE